MDEARSTLLRSELAAQIRLIEGIYLKIEARRRELGKSPVRLESLAYQLHNLYCAFEDLFKIIADYFENTVEERARYHAELLRRMSISIEGIRPALLTD